MKRMKSMYVRQVAILLGLTFLCMVLLGVGFFTLSYRYQLQEIQTTLDRNAGFISSYADAALTKGGSLTDESFVNYIHSVVLLTDTTVFSLRHRRPGPLRRRVEPESRGFQHAPAKSLRPQLGR